MNPELGEAPGPPASFVGDAGLLDRPLLSLLCPTTVPADLVLPTFDFVATRARRDTPFIGGFHGPLERECLDLIFLLHGSAIVSIGRSMAGWDCPARWASAAASRKLLVISEFDDERLRRPTLDLALRRNAAVARRSRALFVPAARAGGRTFRTAKGVIERGLPVHCFDHPANRDLLILGARPICPEAGPGQLLDGFDE